MTAGDGLRCPVCGSDTGVSETRQLRCSIRRRRYCVDRSCSGRMTTVEIPAPMYGKSQTRSFNLVAVPVADHPDLAIVPRSLITKIRELAVLLPDDLPSVEPDPACIVIGSGDTSVTEQ